MRTLKCRVISGYRASRRLWNDLGALPGACASAAADPRKGPGCVAIYSCPSVMGPCLRPLWAESGCGLPGSVWGAASALGSAEHPRWPPLQARGGASAAAADLPAVTRPCRSPWSPPASGGYVPPLGLSFLESILPVEMRGPGSLCPSLPSTLASGSFSRTESWLSSGCPGPLGKTGILWLLSSGH